MKKLNLTLMLAVYCTAFSFAQIPSYVPSNGLVGWWPFNGNANDESGNGNNGTINGSVLSTDRFGNTNRSMQFAQNQYIEVQNLYQNNINGYTISAWFKKPQSNANTDGAIVSGSFPGQAPGGLRLNIGTINRFQWQVEDFPGQNGILQLAPGDNNNYCDNNWHFVVATFSSPNGLISSSSFKIYVDGNLVQTISNNTNWPSWDTTTYAPINNANRNTIIGNCGGSYFNFSNSFLGTLDDIGIWNRALTQQEITALYQGCNLNVNVNPATANAAVGANTNIVASGGTTYQWQTNPANNGWQNVNNNSTYSGTTTASLGVNNVQLQNHQQQFRVISGSSSCVDTAYALINVTDTCINTIITSISVTDTLVINAVITGVNPPNNTNIISIYPNPANTHITIDNGNFALMNGYTIRINNALGQTVFNQTVNQQQFYINLSGWTGSGYYYLDLIDNSGNSVETKVIVVQ